MAKDFAKGFYGSKTWQHCRLAYAKSVGNLCEECLKENKVTAGEIVHHKIHLTPENIKDPDIALNWNNLELVCRECHKKLHEEHTNEFNGHVNRRFYVGLDGKIIVK